LGEENKKKVPLKGQILVLEEIITKCNNRVRSWKNISPRTTEPE
jgi:hypothetical protein